MTKVVKRREDPHRPFQQRLSGRPVARQVAGAVTEATWDRRRVRAALARHLVTNWPGAGVDRQPPGRRFCPDRGGTPNTQRAFGVWAASEFGCVAVSWRLGLSQEWLKDDDRRNRWLSTSAVEPSHPCSGVLVQPLGATPLRPFLSRNRCDCLSAPPYPMRPIQGCAPACEHQAEETEPKRDA